jgi:DNA-directed RNA polymerase subunit RPC12/RpoP
MFGRSLNPLKHEGETRTDLYCHECDKNFIALLDYSIDGNHVVECPHCGHEHCRVIKGGMVTDDRWDGRNSNQNAIKPRRVWKHNSLPMTSNTASDFIRQRWLDKFEG